MLDLGCWMLDVGKTGSQDGSGFNQHPTSKIQHPVFGLQNAPTAATPKEQRMQFFANPVQVKNLGLVDRWASVLGGGALVSYGVKKRSRGGTLLAMLGGDLIYRGTTGYSALYCAVGIAPLEKSLGRSVSIPYQQGIRVDKSITIDKPSEVVFAFWRNLENLPRFMRHVHSLTSLDHKRSHWILQGPAGRIVEWEAEIIH